MSKKIISYIMISLILMLGITPVIGDVSSVEIKEIKKALGLTDVTISDSEFENILNNPMNDYEDSTLLDSARAITLEKNYIESLQKADLQNTILLLDATKDKVSSIDNVAQLGTTEWLGLGGDILRYSIGVPIIAMSWKNIRLHEMIYGSIATPGYVPLREAGWNDDETWDDVYSHFKGDIDTYFKTDQEKKFLHGLFRHAWILKQNPKYPAEVNDKAKILAGIIRERIPESKPSVWEGIFSAITRTIEGVNEKAIEVFNEYIRIPEAHSAQTTPTITPTPTVSLTLTSTPTITQTTVPPPTSTPTLTIDQTLKWPLCGKPSDRNIILGFGEDWTWGYCGGLPKIHTGVDLIANEGEDVYASEAGTVKASFTASQTNNWGKGITIEHQGFTAVYLHIVPLVSSGQIVSKGQKIATIANIAGPHLHYGIRTSPYSDISNRGALPQKNTDENSYCKSDPVFPANFVDPMTLIYEESSLAQPPQITSISPTQNVAGIFNLTINGNNFDSGAIDQIYWKADMSFIGQGVIANTTETKIVSKESMTGINPGVYVAKVKNSDGQLSNGLDFTITEPVSVQYQAHFAYTGWMTDWVQEEQSAGTPNGNQMEAIKIKTTDYVITYRTHVAYDGWLPWVSDSAVAGTTGQSKSLQAIQIKLQNAPPNLHVYYRVYVHGQDWQEWVFDGTTAGTTGLGLAVEAIEIKIQE